MPPDAMPMIERCALQQKKAMAEPVIRPAQIEPCTGCGRALEEGSFIVAKTGIWHPDCYIRQ